MTTDGSGTLSFVDVNTIGGTVTGVIAGATPYVNVVLTALFTLAFYVYSRA